LGRAIATVVRDDQAAPVRAVEVANAFVSDGVNYVIGHFTSSATIPASEVYRDNNILEITPASTNARVTERGLWNVFRTCGRDDQQGLVAGNYIVEHFKGQKVAIVHDKTTYGQGLADIVKKVMNAKGIREDLYEAVNVGDRDFSALVTKIR